MTVKTRVWPATLDSKLGLGLGYRMCQKVYEVEMKAPVFPSVTQSKT